MFDSSGGVTRMVFGVDSDDPGCGHVAEQAAGPRSDPAARAPDDAPREDARPDEGRRQGRS